MGDAGVGSRRTDRTREIRYTLTGLPFPQGLFQSVRTNVLMGLLGVGPDGALLALHRRATFLLVRQVG